MQELLKCREQIDEIDQKIARLFQDRMVISGNVAAYKRATGKKVFDKEREDQKIESVRKYADNDFNEEALGELFRQIMSISRKYQYRLLDLDDRELEFEKLETLPAERKKVVYFGTDGSYTQQAMEAYFGTDIDTFHEDTFRGVMDAIQEGKAQYGVLPIENTSTGGINDIYDLLVEYDHTIIGEQVVKVDQALLVLPEAELSDIKTVYSHPQGLLQCADFLNEHPQIQKKTFSSTAASAQKVWEDGDLSQAAIASVQAAKVFGLKVLKENINFASNNSTRFIIITNKKIYLENADTVSVCFELPHECGSLYNILSHIIYNQLNMTSISSRPIPGKSWEYRFFVDFEGNLEEAAVKNTLYGIAEEASGLKILGNYHGNRETKNKEPKA